MTTFVRLRDRYLSDTRFGGSGATAALTRALEHIGWRAVREPTPEELASEVLDLLEACVHGHRDVSHLLDAMATLFRAAGPALDGGLPPMEAYLPAAAEVLRLYVEGGPPPRSVVFEAGEDPG